MRLLNADGRHCSTGFQPLFAGPRTVPDRQNGYATLLTPPTTSRWRPKYHRLPACICAARNAPDKMPMLPCSRPIVRRSGRHPAQIQPPLLLLALERESAHDQGTIH
jgi:hypothetical protein